MPTTNDQPPPAPSQTANEKRPTTVSAISSHPLRIFISAGEASGDLYGAQLIEALRRLRPDLEVFGLGGEHMRAAGCETLVDAKDIAVVGITEILRHLPRIYARFGRLRRVIAQRRPDVGVVIDSPAFNLRLARTLHRRGIPVVYYVAPQFWAWRQWRARIVRRYVRRALTIFPFEVEFWRHWGVPAQFVGHPLAEAARPSIARTEMARENGLDAAKLWITLMPGSRRREVEMNLPIMLAAATRLGQGYEFLLPVAPTLETSFLRGLMGQGSRIRLLADARSALVHSRAAVVASGTATVEAAMMATPFVMVYRVSPLSFALGRPLVKLRHFAMVNLIAGEEVVPELVQADFTPESVISRLEPLLAETPQRVHMLQGLERVRNRLRADAAGHTQSAAERAAEAVLAALS
ncbi:MAG TPA: lipid-A-disaccharide synthase [Terriglobales bacterium]|nr:lipid-A-disaccharide synthase [Terriglobales bacterium]